MRKLIKLAGLAIGAGAVAYLMKDRLVPVPEGPTEEPPAFRVPPAPQPALSCVSNSGRSFPSTDSPFTSVTTFPFLRFAIDKRAVC